MRSCLCSGTGVGGVGSIFAADFVTNFGPCVASVRVIFQAGSPNELAEVDVIESGRVVVEEEEVGLVLLAVCGIDWAQRGH